MNFPETCVRICLIHYYTTANIRILREVFTFTAAFPVVVHSLEYLRDNGDTKSGQQLAAILRFDFIIALVVCSHILQGVVPLTGMLQAKNFDLIEAIKESKTIINMLDSERNDETVFDALFDRAVEIADQFEVHVGRPRTAGVQRNRANPPNLDPKAYWRITLYYTFLDHLIMELRDRLVGNEDRFIAQYLFPSNIVGQPLDRLRVIQIYAAYNSDLDDQEVLWAEVQRWRARWTLLAPEERSSNIVDTLSQTDKMLYPNIFKILQILGTMPPTTSTAERSFSAMKRLKTYLRSTMSDDRLSSLALLYINHDIKIDRDMVIDRFTGMKNRKMML